MNANTATAYRRLFAVATLAAIGASFACRPAWSPDSKQVAFPGVIDGKLFLARYDLETKTSEIVMATDAPKLSAVPHYLSNGELLVLANKAGDDKPLVLTRVPIGPGAADKQVPGPFEVTTKDEATNHMILPPVIVNDRLYLGGKSLARVNLTTGETLHAKLPEASPEVVLSRRGNGICYVTVRDKADESRWELGTIDPKTLARTTLFQAPKATEENPGWKVLPLPCFTTDLKRVALPGERVGRTSTEQTQTAILIFHDGKLENVLPLSDQIEEVAVGSLAWGPDDVSLFSVIARKTDDGQRFALYETNFSGSVTRETALHDAPPATTTQSALVPVLQMQLALSPNGKWAAVSTAYLADSRDQERSLLLVDVTGKQRTVEAVPFPQPADEKR